MSDINRNTIFYFMKNGKSNNSKNSKDSIDDWSLEESRGDSPADSGTSSDVENSCPQYGRKNSFDSENIYKFFLNENRYEETDSLNMVNEFGEKLYNVENDFSTIRSSRGTIRGVRNRVRTGIATFLQMNSTKTWQEREAGNVVVYTTSMGVVRDTYLRCIKVRNILRTLLIKYTEKDAFMSRDIQTEIKERMGVESVKLPQVFVEGQYLGDADTVEKLNETGELRKMLKPYKDPDVCTTCKICGGYRLLPCDVCNGSKKSIHRNHFSSELVALKCMNCNEVGLVKCYAC